MHCLLYRDGKGYLPALTLVRAAMPTLAASDPPVHTSHRRAVFPELVDGACARWSTNPRVIGERR